MGCIHLSIKLKIRMLVLMQISMPHNSDTFYIVISHVLQPVQLIQENDQVYFQ